MNEWLNLEKYLLSGEMEPEVLLGMLGTAQKKLLETIANEERFLKKRAVATKVALKARDWNAIQRVLAMKDTIAEINSERMFYGGLEKLGRAGKLAKFGELITSLRVSNDQNYAKWRQKLALAGLGIGTQIGRTSQRVKNLAELYAEGKIDAPAYLRENLLAEYALTHQYFSLTEAGEKLFAHLGRQTRDKDLKKVLDSLSREMKRRKLFYRSEKARIEFEFKINPERYGYPPQK